MVYDRYKKIVVVLILIVTVFMLWQLKSLNYNYDFESFFPRNSEDTEFFKQYRTDFETDNDYVLLGIQNDAGVFQQDFLEKVHRLTLQLEELDSVEMVISPTNVMEFRRYSMHPALVEVPYLNWDQPAGYAEDSAKIFNSYELSNTVFSEKAPVVAIVVKHKDFLPSEACMELSSGIQLLLKEFRFDEVHLAGRCEGQNTYVSLIQNETMVFVGSSMLLIILFLFIAYRSFWGIWMPLSVVGLVVIWTMGVMVMTGKALDLLSNIIPTVLMVIGISAVVHLLTNFLSLRGGGVDRIPAIVQSVKEVGLATLMTTVTTMIGFLTLLNSSVQPVVDLGVYACIGLIFAFILTYSWFPSLLLLHPPITAKKNQKVNEYWLNLLTATNGWVSKRYKAIVWMTLLFSLGAIFATTWIKKDNYILDGLKWGHPQRADFRFFKDNFAGARPFEMKIWVKDSNQSLLDRENLEALQLMHSYLDSVYGVGALISPVSLVKTANRIQHAGKTKYYKIPESKKAMKKLEREIFRFSKQGNTGLYLKRNHQEARVVGKIPDWGSHLVNQKNEDFNRFWKENMANTKLEYRLTGSATLMDINTSYIASNVIEGLLIAIAIIALIVGFLFRSWRMAMVSIIPNLIPLLVCGAVMGIFHIDFNLSTSIIFIISFGIAVDDSIHFLARLRQELKNQNNDLHAALLTTFQSTGKAIIVTTLILSGGFLTLCFSDFLGTFYIGLLICITLLVALICDLVLLPAIILMIWNKKRSAHV